MAGTEESGGIGYQFIGRLNMGIIGFLLFLFVIGKLAFDFMYWLTGTVFKMEERYTDRHNRK